MLFKLAHLPTSSSNFIQKILVENPYIFIIVYKDHILVYTNKKSHINSLQSVFIKLRLYFFYVNLKKSYFYQKEVKVLTYVVFSNSISIEEKQIEVLHYYFER